MSGRIPASLLAALCGALLLPSCIFSIGGDGKQSRARWAWEDEKSVQSVTPAEPAKAAQQSAAKPAAKGDPKGDPAKRELELAKKGRALGHGELELTIAEAKAAEQLESTELELQKAARAVAEAELDLATFLEHAQPQALAKGELEVERKLFELQQKRQELQQLVDDYQAHGGEFYAKRTGEIVVGRAQRVIELLEMGLEQQRAALDLERERELPKKQRALEFALEQARAGLSQAEAKRQRARIEAHLTVEKARAKLEDLRAELELLERGEGEGKEGGGGAEAQDGGQAS